MSTLNSIPALAPHPLPNLAHMSFGTLPCKATQSHEGVLWGVLWRRIINVGRGILAGKSRVWQHQRVCVPALLIQCIGFGSHQVLNLGACAKPIPTLSNIAIVLVVVMILVQVQVSYALVVGSCPCLGCWIKILMSSCSSTISLSLSFMTSMLRAWLTFVLA